MWHASIASHVPGVPLDELWRAAMIALAGVGDAGAGEWREVGERAVHLRRRLSAVEAARVGPVVDIRGTWDARKRVQRMARYVPPHLQGIEQ